MLALPSEELHVRWCADKRVGCPRMDHQSNSGFGRRRVCKLALSGRCGLDVHRVAMGIPVQVTEWRPGNNPGTSLGRRAHRGSNALEGDASVFLFERAGDGLGEVPGCVAKDCKHERPFDEGRYRADQSG